MAVAGNLVINMTAQEKDLYDKLNASIRAMARWKQKMESNANATQGINRGLGDIGRSFGGMIKQAGAFAIALGVVKAVTTLVRMAWEALKATVMAVFGFIKKTITAFAEWERAKVTVSIFTRSLEETQQVLSDIVSLSLRTPFLPQDLIDGAKLALGTGASLKDLGHELEFLSNVAAGSGANMRELLFVFNQSRAEGKVLTRDVRQFASQGIPLFNMLMDHFGLMGNRGASVMKEMIEAGKVSFMDISKVLEKSAARGGLYFEANLKLSKTLEGAWNTLAGAVKLSMSNIGEAMNKMFGIGNMLLGVAQAMSAVAKTFTKRAEEMREGAHAFSADTWADLFLMAAEKIMSVGAHIADFFIGTFQLLSAVFNGWISNLLDGVAHLLRGFAKLSGMLGFEGMQAKAMTASVGAADYAAEFQKAREVDLANWTHALSKDVENLFKDIRSSLEEIRTDANKPFESMFGADSLTGLMASGISQMIGAATQAFEQARFAKTSLKTPGLMGLTSAAITSAVMTLQDKNKFKLAKERSAAMEMGSDSAQNTIARLSENAKSEEQMNKERNDFLRQINRGIKDIRSRGAKGLRFAGF